MSKGWILPGLCLLVTALVPAAAPELKACSDFRIKATDGAVIVGRTMDFPVALQSRVRVFPRGQERSSDAPTGGQGLQWRSTHGFVGVYVLGLEDHVADGLNEKGLSFAWLYLPGFTHYQDEAAARQPGQAIANWDFGAWVLGNFATVAEVRQAVGQVHVWGKFFGPLNIVPPLHASLHDALGNSLVLEYTRQGLKIHDNKVGVLTNEPTYDWHLGNLRHYLNPKGAPARLGKGSNSALRPVGAGNGLLDIPGDWASPSRFVRLALMTESARPARDAAEGITLAAHLLSTVHIPRGVERLQENDPDECLCTRWLVIKDLRHRVFHFRAYDSHVLRAVSLPKLDLRPGAQGKSIPLSGSNGILDVSGELK